MAVIDQGAGATLGAGASDHRSLRTATSMGIVAAILAFANITDLTTAYKVNSFRYAITSSVFYFNTTELVAFILILIAGGVLAIVRATRSAGFGILLAFSGLLTLEWTGMLSNWYSGQYAYHNLNAGQVIAFLVGLGLAVALAAVAAIGIVADSPATAPDRRHAGARAFFALAAVGALVWVLFYVLYPYQSAFRSFVPVGNILDLIGIVGGVGTFVLLAVVPGRRAPAVGATVTWCLTALFLLLASATNNYGSWPFTEFSYRRKYELGIPAIVVVAIFGLIACARRSPALDRTAFPAGQPTLVCLSGHPMPPAAAFCPSCGSPAAPAFIPGNPVCPNGHVIPLGDSFCSDCGMAALVQSPAAWTSDDQPTSRGLVATSGSTRAAAPLGDIPTTNGFAIGALISGILGLSVLAIAFGFVARSQIQKSAGRQKGGGMAMAGIVLGIIWVVLSIIFTIAILAVVAHQNNGA